MGISIQQRMTDTGGRTTGFDYLRIGLAVAVVFWHTFPIAYGPVAGNFGEVGAIRPFYFFILPSFFALSGFLVAGSLERNRSLIRFASLRALRIVPALAVEVVLSALLLGSLLTTLPLRTYFANPELHHYFLNIVGLIHFQLPGLFETNPLPRIVNRQLWTIPYELRCYIALALFAGFAIERRRWLFLICVVAIQVFDFAQCFGHHPLGHGGINGWQLVLAFLDGVLIYKFRDLLPLSGRTYIASLALSFALLSWIPLGDRLALPVLAYATVYTGLLNPKATILVKFGDLSYGVYLYGFAVQQFVASWGNWTHEWYLNFAFTLPIVSLVACFSWYCIERPALGLRKHLVLLDPLDRWIASVQTAALSQAESVP